jgi:hypothetical protein
MNLGTPLASLNLQHLVTYKETHLPKHVVKQQEKAFYISRQSPCLGITRNYSILDDNTQYIQVSEGLKQTNRSTDLFKTFHTPNEERADLFV